MIVKLFFLAGLIFITGVIMLNFLRLPGTSSPSGLIRPEEVSFEAPDGVSIQADWIASDQANPRSVVLIHMLGGDRSSWGVLPDKLRAKGFAVLALDLRGHGKSVVASGSALNFDNFTDSDWAKITLDLQGALSFLETRKISPAQVSFVGASIGANAALIQAAASPALRSVVLLSPAESYHGLNAFSAADSYKGRRALIIASSEDTPAYSDSQKLAQLMGAPANFLGQSKVGHGTEMLAADPNLADQIVSYLLAN